MKGVSAVTTPTEYGDATSARPNRASASANSVSSILVRKIGGQERSAVLILYPMILMLIVMSILMPSFYQPMAVGDLGLMAAIGFLSVIAQSAIIGAYRAAPAAVVAPLQYSQILWAALFAGAALWCSTPPGPGRCV